MSVRKKDRAENRFTVLDRTIDVYSHTVTVMENEKIFGSKYQKLQDRIENSAAMIYHCCRTANEDCDAREKEGASERLDLQEAAIEYCTKLKTDIRLAKRVFRLRAKKVTYWNDIVNDAMKLIKAWNQAERKRFRETFGL